MFPRSTEYLLLVSLDVECDRVSVQLLAMPASSFCSRLRTTRLCFLAADITLANSWMLMNVYTTCAYDY